MTRLQRLIIIATLATQLLIIVGATVRASGAGLGCPDWPKCFGLWIPPTSADQLPPGFDREAFNAQKTWTEYGNRLAGVTVGFLILAATIAAIRAWRRKEASRLIAFEMIGTILITGGQAWLGGLVVKKELDPRFVTLHFVLALVMLGLLVHAAWLSFHTEKAASTAKPSQGVRRALCLALATLALVSVQVVLGAIVRGTLEIVASEDPLLPRGDRLAEVGFSDWLHRKVALATLIAGIGAAWMTRRLPVWKHSRILRFSTTGSVLLLAAQVGVGLTLAYWTLPAISQVAHISMATALWSLLFLQCLALRASTTVKD
ncbi:MAG: COX15/CtaA family protein [Planctomycetota bacterium]